MVRDDYCFGLILCRFVYKCCALFLFYENHVLGITYVIEDLIPDTAYLIRVASLNPSGLSDWMGPKEFRTHIAAVPTTGSTATSIGIFPNTISFYFIHLMLVGIVYHRSSA